MHSFKGARQLFEPDETVTFGTFDHPDADLRELDGTKGVILNVHTEYDPWGEVDVSTQYGWLERVDPFCFIEARKR